MTTIERRLEHLETTITSLRTIPEAIKDLGTRSDTVLQTLQVRSTILQVQAEILKGLADDVAWIREKLS